MSSVKAVLMALLGFGLATVLVQGASIHGKQVGEINDVYSLMQTDVFVTHKSIKKSATVKSSSAAQSESGMANHLLHILKKAWQWVMQADQLETSAIEATKRFHKDFIAAAMLMTCILPWSRQSQSLEDNSQGAARSRLWRFLPSGRSLRCLSVALLWLKHYCFQGHHAAIEIMFVLVGIIFDFAEQHSDAEDDLWSRLGACVPERFAKLYPLYTLHVLVCYLVFFSSPSSTIETFFGSNALLSYTCGLGAWLLSVLFGCYLVVTMLAAPPQHIDPSSVAMVCAGCVAMVVLPRTLAAPVHAWSETQYSDAALKAQHSNVVYELIFSRRSLLLGLAHFFFGVVLARIRLVIDVGAWFSCSGASDPAKEAQVGVKSSRPAAVDLWKAFEDEAKQDMLRSLSVNRPTVPADVGYSMSPRSNFSD